MMVRMFCHLQTVEKKKKLVMVEPSLRPYIVTGS